MVLVEGGVARTMGGTTVSKAMEVLRDGRCLGDATGGAWVPGSFFVADVWLCVHILLAGLCI